MVAERIGCRKAPARTCKKFVAQAVWLAARRRTSLCRVARARGDVDGRGEEVADLDRDRLREKRQTGGRAASALLRHPLRLRHDRYSARRRQKRPWSLHPADGWQPR